MARSGYEIRLDVLRLAKDLADDRFHQELGRVTEHAIRTESDYELPADEREQQTLELAKKFYSFVQDENA